MPRETFFNLDDEKRERVFNAIIKEFSSVPLEDVSIKNIVNEAGIPRGSFYQYFDHKEDVLRYLISNTRNEGEQEILQEKALENKDLFDFIYFIYCREVNFLKKDSLSPRMQLLNQISKSPLSLTIFNEEISKAATESPLFKELWAGCGFSHLSENEHKAVIELFISALKEAFLSILLDKHNEEGVQKQLKLKLAIIREGIASVLKVPQV